MKSSVFNTYRQQEHTTPGSYMFNQNEVAFCGYSKSGKTTLITKLINELTFEFTIGYVKHDAHRFEMDKKGKDTYLTRKSGASAILINDPSQWAFISNKPMDYNKSKSLFAEMDIVFVEGYKDSTIPKIVLIDEQEKIIEDINAGRFSNIFTFVGSKFHYENLPLGIPYFNRDEMVKIKECILEFIVQRVSIQNHSDSQEL